MSTQEKILILCLAAAGLAGLIFLIYALRPRPRYPYERKNLLTDNEWAFYQILSPVCERNGWQILMKMRLADILAVREGTEDYTGYFNKIKAKHTDFILVQPDTLKVLAGVELDDASHLRQDREERDIFVDNAYNAAGIPLLHVWMPITEEELEKALTSLLQEN